MDANYDILFIMLVKFVLIICLLFSTVPVHGVVACCKENCLSLSNTPSFFSGSPNFHGHHPSRPSITCSTYLLYELLIWSRPKYMKYLPLDFEQLSIKINVYGVLVYISRYDTLEFAFLIMFLLKKGLLLAKNRLN